MCGIAGTMALNPKGRQKLSSLPAALSCLRNRGPDAQGTFIDGPVALAHTRLAIIDTSSAGAQPMTDPSGRYTLVFNGEFFNFPEHRKALLDKGIALHSH